MQLLWDTGFHCSWVVLLEQDCWSAYNCVTSEELSACCSQGQHHFTFPSNAQEFLLLPTLTNHFLPVYIILPGGYEIMSRCEPCLHSMLAEVLNNPIHAQPLPLGLQALLKCPSYIRYEYPQFVRAPWVDMLIPSYYFLSPRDCRSTGPLVSFSGT